MLANFIKMVKTYKPKYLKDDFTAGLSVAAIALPQNMAYALIVGVSPIYGLYTSIVSMIVATFTGISNYMVVGPTNMMSVALASSLAPINSGNYLQAMLLLTLMVGVMQVVLGMLQLGKLVRFVSHSVIVGLTTGAALLIAIGQLNNLLGLAVKGNHNLFITLYKVVANLQNLNYYSLLIGLLSIGIIIVTKRLSSKAPPYLLAIIISMLVVYIFNLSDKLAVVENFSSSLPEFRLVDFNPNMMQSLFSSALSVAILGFIQATSIVKSLANRTKQEPELNKEFVSQGIINIICSFFSSFAISGSFTNSFANYAAGAKTRISELITALTITLFILVFSSAVNYIPIASLAALVILVALSMIDKEEIIRSFKTNKYDALVFTVTFMATILAPRIDYAVYFGVLTSIIVVLQETSNINYSHISYDEEEEVKFSHKNLNDVKEDEFIIINLAGNLHFNSSENLKEELNESFRENKVFLIRTRELESIDITSMQELDKFIDKVQTHNGKVLLCGVDDELLTSLEEFGIIDKVDRNNIFCANENIFSSTKEAIEEVKNNKEVS